MEINTQIRLVWGVHLAIDTIANYSCSSFYRGCPSAYHGLRILQKVPVVVVPIFNEALQILLEYLCQKSSRLILPSPTLASRRLSMMDRLDLLRFPMLRLASLVSSIKLTEPFLMSCSTRFSNGDSNSNYVSSGKISEVESKKHQTKLEIFLEHQCTYHY